MTTANANAPVTNPQPHAVFVVALADIGLHLPNHRNAPDPAAVERLAASIAADGQQSPIKVALRADWAKGKERYTLIFGHRRLLAMQHLGRDTIDAQILPAQPTARILEMRLIENHQREDLTAGEEIFAVKQLLDSIGQDVDLAAATIGESLEWVRDRRYLSQRLHGPAMELAYRGALLIGHLRQLCKIGDPIEQWKVATRAAGLSSWVLKEGTLEADGKHYADQVDAFWQDVAEGSQNRMTIAELELAVEAATMSLRGVPWELDCGVVPKKGDALPGCSGCPHNTATDVTLFGIEDETGRCLNAACFSAKKHASEQAVELAVKTIAKRKQPDAGAATIDAVKPVWLKRGAAQRAVKKAIEPATPAKTSQSYEGPSKRGAERMTPEQQHWQAEQEWREAAHDLLTEALDRNPLVALRLYMLTMSKTWESLSGGRRTEEAVTKAVDWVKRSRGITDLDQPDVLQEIAGDLVATGSGRCWMIEECIMHWDLPDEVMYAIAWVIPEEIELPPKPVLADFQPEPEPPAKTPTKKKVGKKASTKQAAQADAATTKPVPEADDAAASNVPPAGHDQPNAHGVLTLRKVIEVDIPKTVGRLAVLIGQGPDGEWRSGFQLDMLGDLGCVSSPVMADAKGFDSARSAAHFRLVRMRDVFSPHAKELPVKVASVYKALDKASKQLDALIDAAPWQDMNAIDDEDAR